MKNRIKYPIAYAAAIMLIGFTACEENLPAVLPADGNVAFVNFVNAGEAFLYGQQNDALYRDNRLYINDSVNNPPFDKYNGRANYPMVFTYEPGLDIRQYPRHFTGVSSVTTPISADVYWLPVHAGDYRFIFTSRDKTYLLTENKTLGKQSYHILYLVESAETDSSYIVVDVPIEYKERMEGKVSVQLVNLSPDAGDVEVYRVDAAGVEMAAVSAAPLSLGHHQSAEFEIAGSESTYNSILLRFRSAGGGEDLQSVAVPAENGAVYTVLLRGFAQETVRKVKKDNYSYVVVNIMPDLRTSLRRVFY
ncbi:MAG: hypothetical protein AB2L24_23860 [Mangrovibacterium sp.]